MSERQQSIKSKGRRLIGSPLLLQDWNDQAEEGAAQYWELFLDLLLVAAASSIADQFKDNLSLYGLGEFVVFYFSIVNGWLLYTHHITSRVEDSSLGHSLVLFVYCVGYGGCIVNAGYEHVRTFVVFALLLRGSVLVMLGSVACSIPRARYFSGVLTLVIGLTMLLLVMVLAVWGEDGTKVGMALFWLAAAVEFLGEGILVFVVEGQRLVPINIEQTKDRLGALVLVMLGETVLSVTIIYRDLLEKGEIYGVEEEEEDGEDHEHSQHPYYWVMGFSFLLIFMFLLLYFHMQPNPADHALRRSRFHGTLLLLIHKSLGLSLLAVGVSVKLIVESLLLHEHLPSITNELMGYGVASSLFLLFIMRYLHYGNRDGINFGRGVYYYGSDVSIDRMALVWWWTVGLAAFLPLLGVWISLGKEDPLVLTGVNAGFLFLLCSLESFYSQTIQDWLENHLNGQDEEDALLSSDDDKAAYT